MPKSFPTSSEVKETRNVLSVGCSHNIHPASSTTVSQTSHYAVVLSMSKQPSLATVYLTLKMLDESPWIMILIHNQTFYDLRGHFHDLIGAVASAANSVGACRSPFHVRRFSSDFTIQYMRIVTTLSNDVHSSCLLICKGSHIFITLLGFLEIDFSQAHN